MGERANGPTQINNLKSDYKVMVCASVLSIVLSRI